MQVTPEYLLGYKAAKDSYALLSENYERVEQEDVLDEIYESYVPYMLNEMEG